MGDNNIRIDFMFIYLIIFGFCLENTQSNSNDNQMRFLDEEYMIKNYNNLLSEEYSKIPSNSENEEEVEINYGFVNKALSNLNDNLLTTSEVRETKHKVKFIGSSSSTTKLTKRPIAKKTNNISVANQLQDLALTMQTNNKGLSNSERNSNFL